MSATFFSKYAGALHERLVDVRFEAPHVLVDLDSLNEAHHPVKLTPHQSREIGRALIKAGKFAEKPEAKK